MDVAVVVVVGGGGGVRVGYSVQFLRARSVIHPRLRQKLSKRGIMSAMGLWENHRLHHLASTMPRTRALVPGVAEDSAFRACSRR